jgi:hypothetical protein
LLKEEMAMEGTQGQQGAQGMPPPGAMLDRIEAAVAQDPERARQTIDQLKTELQSLPQDQKAQLAEKLVQRVQAMSPEQQEQLKDIIAMVRG